MSRGAEPQGDAEPPSPAASEGSAHEASGLRFDIGALRHELRLRWFGLRFASDSSERAYRLWHRRVARPFMRVGHAASMVAWLLAIVVSYLAKPTWVAPTSFWVLTIMIPALLWGMATTYLDRLLPLMFPSAGLANIVAGMLVVWLATHVWNSTTIAVSGVIIVAYFGYTIFRFHVGQAAVAVTVYVAYYEWTALGLVRADSVSRPDAVVLTLMPLVVVATGLLACAVLDRVTRERYVQERVVHLQSRALEHERQRADDLLYNMLPVRIAERLKQDSGAIAETFDQVTVLFADFEGFTPLAETMPPSDLVALLNRVFARFDRLSVHHGVEKIKTIGDAYMAVAGLPSPCDDHAERALDLAFALRDAVREIAEETGVPLRLRSGLHSGSVVAGVIGRKKLAYDLWGDVVNTAARMESHGVPDKVQITDGLRASLSDGYAFERRGDLDIKGKGRMTTWLVEPSTDARR